MLDVAAALSETLVYLQPGTTTVVTGGRLIDGSGAAPIGPATIVVRGDRIEAVGPAGCVAVPSGPSIRVLDVAGQTVLPGLIDAHVHLTGDTGRSAYEEYLPGNAAYKTLRAGREAMKALRSGFTTMRVLGHGPAERVYALRQAVAEGWLPGPRLLTSGWAISQSGGHGNVSFLPPDLVQRFRPRSAFADGPEECRRMVRLNFGEGADLIKIYTSEHGPARGRNITNFTIDEIRAMADEAHARGAKVAAHATNPEGVRLAIEGGVDTIEHGGDLSGEVATLRMMADRGTFLIPTLYINHAVATEGAARAWSSEDRLPAVVERARRLLDAQRSFLKRAFGMGVKIAVGTDGGALGHGISARELELLVWCGLSPMEALTAGTETAAAALGLEDHVGTLAEGRLGELIVVNADPLADIRVLQRPENIKWILKSTNPLT